LGEVVEPTRLSRMEERGRKIPDSIDIRPRAPQEKGNVALTKKNRRLHGEAKEKRIPPRL